MNIILLVLHVLLAFSIITLILLQKGKGAAEGATFGGGGSGGGAGSVFGASGSANFLSKTTAILATIFFVNSLALAYLAANREAPSSVLDAMTQSAEQGAGDVAIETTLEKPVEDLLPPADDTVQSTVDIDVPPPAE